MVADRRQNDLHGVFRIGSAPRTDRAQRAQGAGPGHRQLLSRLPDVDADSEDDHGRLIAVDWNRIWSEDAGGTPCGGFRHDELTEDAGDLACAGPAGHCGHGRRVIGQGDDVVGPLGSHAPGQVLNERGQGVTDCQAAQQRQPAQALGGDEGPEHHGDQEGASVVGGDPGAPGPPSAGGLSKRSQCRQVRPGSALRSREGCAQVVLGGSGDGNGVETREGAAA